ncbi:ABC-2 family transporter protein [Desulfosporosinus acididurans]|uniref:ABC-2 family transporter protein n=2 Tax=Desulfosporosinus acididurans TaxID=476652 RepID=A0A0J1FQ54_9FIRM|nr:ABC-2 family transporter protein [Desulfosporosinus acididurans]
MMNDALYWSMLKYEGKKVIGYSLGLMLYEWLITWVYPILIESPVIEDLPNSFPTPVKRAFGVSEEETDISYESYISAQLLGRFWTLLISVYGISASNALTAHMLEQGFMAYPLSAPVSRSEIINTQIGVLLTELMMVTGATVGGIYSAAAFFKVTIDRWGFFRMGILGFCLSTVVSGYSMLFGVSLNSEEVSVPLVSALTVIFYGLDVMSSLSERFAGLQNVTPFALFRPQEVLRGKLLPTKECLILSCISGTCLFLSGFVFRRKNLAI